MILSRYVPITSQFNTTYINAKLNIFNHEMQKPNDSKRHAIVFDFKCGNGSRK